MEKWLSVAEVAIQANVPETTTRRYLTRFERFFRFDERSRGRRYHPDTVEIVALIQSLYSAGAEIEEIERVLIRDFAINDTTVEVSTTTQPPSH